MNTPPNRPQVQRPTLEECLRTESFLREMVICDAMRGVVSGPSQERYNALERLGIVSSYDAAALRIYCCEIALQASKENAA